MKHYEPFLTHQEVPFCLVTHLNSMSFSLANDIIVDEGRPKSKSAIFERQLSNMTGGFLFYLNYGYLGLSQDNGSSLS